MRPSLRVVENAYLPAPVESLSVNQWTKTFFITYAQFPHWFLRTTPFYIYSEVRRRSTRRSTTVEENVNPPGTKEIREEDNRTRLRLLSTFLSILTESVERLQNSQTVAKSDDNKKTLEVTSFSSESENKVAPISPLCELITPLVNHLIK